MSDGIVDGKYSELRDQLSAFCSDDRLSESKVGDFFDFILFPLMKKNSMIIIENFVDYYSIPEEISGDPHLSAYDTFDELFEAFLEIVDYDLDNLIEIYQGEIEEITEDGCIVNIAYIADIEYMSEKNGIFFHEIKDEGGPFAIFFNNKETYNKFEVLIETTDVFELKGVEKKNK